MRKNSSARSRGWKGVEDWGWGAYVVNGAKGQIEGVLEGVLKGEKE